MIDNFWSFDKLADFNYGIKGFEVRFQKMIEEFLVAHEIDELWWKYYDKSLFNQILDIYENNIRIDGNDYYEDEQSIITELNLLYDKVKEVVMRNVKKKRMKNKRNRMKWEKIIRILKRD